MKKKKRKMTVKNGKKHSTPLPQIESITQFYIEKEFFRDIM